MIKQDPKQDLTPTMQNLSARMARMQSELNELKEKARALPLLSIQTEQAVQTTRRGTLKRLGLALLGGIETAGALGAAPAAHAKVTANPQGTLSNKAGMLVVPPGAADPTGTAPAFTYGLIASGDNPTTLTLSNLPVANTGIFGAGVNGVYGTGSDTGVYGSGSTGIHGVGTNTGVSGSGNTYGIYGAGPTGVYGSGNTYGIYGNGPNGIYGIGSDTGVTGYGPNFGVYGYSAKASGMFGSFIGAVNATSNAGVIGNAGSVSVNLNGINASTNIGVYGAAGGSGTNYAGYFQGDVNVTGTVSKGGGSFKIDHPLDPTNKYLYHSFVESPDMLNIYNGIVSLDEKGQATVEMPDWFEALNSNFRYQLTPVGFSMPNLFIAGEIEDKKFKIGGGQAGQRVSWQVTGIRQDAWANANRIPVEEVKNDHEKGKYLHPEAFGQPVEI